MSMLICLAYIDPGAGSILLQLLIGSIVGVGLFFRHSVARLLGRWRRDGRAKPSAPAPAADDLLGKQS